MSCNRTKNILNELAKNTSIPSKEIEKAKQVLGKQISYLTDEEIRDIVAETRFLVESWLDTFEKQAFGGKTLQELLYERNRM